MRGRIDAAAAGSQPGSRAEAEARRVEPAAPATGPARLVIGYRAGVSPTAMARHVRDAGLSAQDNRSLAKVGRPGGDRAAG